MTHPAARRRSIAGARPLRLAPDVTRALPLGVPDGDQPATQGPDRHLLGAEVYYRAAQRDVLHGPTTEGLGVHLARVGPMPSALGGAGGQLLQIVDEVGLTGRGGAHFPVAAKWRSTITAVQERHVRRRIRGGRGESAPGEVLVVANGAEGEPASAKDAALLQHRPHLVLDGLVAVAEVVGADAGVVWLHESADQTRQAVARALAERRAARHDSVPISLATGPDRYLTGEANAVVQALDGGPAVPWFRTVPAAQGGGVDGQPTLVHNVETLARTALLARTGVPTEASGPAGGVLTSVLGRLTSGQAVITVRELPPQCTVADAVLDRYGHEVAPRAVLIGGYGGTWLSWEEAADLTLGRLDRRRAPGAGLLPGEVTLGAGVLAALPADACGVAETASVATYLADSSARQCGPCLFGTRALAELWTRIAQGRARRGDEQELARISAQLVRRGACALPDAAVNLTLSAARVFADDVRGHLAGAGCVRGCRAGSAAGPAEAWSTVLPVPRSA
ncbi:MAG: hypothetical protein JNL54_16335 [Kineosporiaceae bacterium]|nr:hypothetical protein [Kineosporiaceae bacterium]